MNNNNYYRLAYSNAVLNTTVVYARDRIITRPGPTG
jgi:hypothetical protein